jgi:hypothetical protein
VPADDRTRKVVVGAQERFGWVIKGVQMLSSSDVTSVIPNTFYPSSMETFQPPICRKGCVSDHVTKLTPHICRFRSPTGEPRLGEVSVTSCCFELSYHSTLLETGAFWLTRRLFPSSLLPLQSLRIFRGRKRNPKFRHRHSYSMRQSIELL